MADDKGIKENGIPVPKEGTPEFKKLNKMAKKAIPLILIIFTLGILEQQAFGMIFINIGQELGQAKLAPLITSIPGIVLGIVCVIYGSLGDFISLKKMTIWGTLAFVIGSIIGFVGGKMNIWAVIIARVLQAAGGQVAGSVFLVLVSKYIAKEDRVVYYQIFTAVFRLSAALGVVLAGYVAKLDWRWLFSAPILAILFVPSLAKNLPDFHAEGAQIDWIGFTLIGLLAGAITMFFTDMNIYWGIAIAVTLIAFIVYINKAKNPFITPSFFKNKAFVATMSVIFIGYFFSYMVNPGANAIGLNVFGIDSAEVSRLLVWSILLAAVLGLAGPVIRKIGRKASITIALSCMGLGLIILAFCIPHGKTMALAVAPCVYYFGTAFFYSPIVDTATLTVSAEESGRVLGFNDLIQALTGSIGAAFFSGLMSNHSMSKHTIVAGLKTGVQTTYANVFILGGIIVLAALVIYLLCYKMIYRKAREEGRI